MKRLLMSILVLCGAAQAQYLGAPAIQNCYKGGQNVVTQGVLSAGTLPIGTPASGAANGAGVMASYPLATVTVYQTGTANLAAIYSNNTSVPTPLGNPFTANADGSFLFYASGFYGPYDIVCSGTALPSPVTYTGVDVGYFLGFDINGNASGIPGSLTIGGPLIIGGNPPYWSGTNTTVACSTLTTAATSIECQNLDGNYYISNLGGSFYLIQTANQAVPFSTLPLCGGGTQGWIRMVSDSTTNTWGATISGSGGDVVEALCNGTNWTVMGK